MFGVLRLSLGLGLGFHDVLCLGFRAETSRLLGDNSGRDEDLTFLKAHFPLLEVVLFGYYLGTS